MQKLPCYLLDCGENGEFPRGENHVDGKDSGRAFTRLQEAAVYQSIAKYFNILTIGLATHCVVAAFVPRMLPLAKHPKCPAYG